MKQIETEMVLYYSIIFGLLLLEIGLVIGFLTKSNLILSILIIINTIYIILFLYRFMRIKKNIGGLKK